MARRFASAIDKAKYDEAAALFLVDGEAAMLTDWQPLVEAHAVPNRLTVSDLIRGRRAIYLSVTYQAKVSDISGFFPLEADFRGIYKLDMRAKDMDRFQETTLPKQVDGR